MKKVINKEVQQTKILTEKIKESKPASYSDFCSEPSPKTKDFGDKQKDIENDWAIDDEYCDEDTIPLFSGFGKILPYIKEELENLGFESPLNSKRSNRVLNETYRSSLKDKFSQNEPRDNNCAIEGESSTLTFMPAVFLKNQTEKDKGKANQPHNTINKVVSGPKSAKDEDNRSMIQSKQGKIERNPKNELNKKTNLVENMKKPDRNPSKGSRQRDKIVAQNKKESNKIRSNSNSRTSMTRSNLNIRRQEILTQVEDLSKTTTLMRSYGNIMNKSLTPDRKYSTTKNTIFDRSNNKKINQHRPENLIDFSLRGEKSPPQSNTPSTPTSWVTGAQTNLQGQSVNKSLKRKVSPIQQERLNFLKPNSKMENLSLTLGKAARSYLRTGRSKKMEFLTSISKNPPSKQSNTLDLNQECGSVSMVTVEDGGRLLNLNRSLELDSLRAESRKKTPSKPQVKIISKANKIEQKPPMKYFFLDHIGLTLAS